MDSNPFQYTGRENDGDGLLYYRTRYYCPGWGRFISADPMSVGETLDAAADSDALEPASAVGTDQAGVERDLNPYTYADDNPVNGGDPTGRFTLTQIIVPIAATAIAVGPPITSPNTPHGWAEIVNLAFEEAQADGVALDETSWWDWGPKVKHHVFPQELRARFDGIFGKGFTDRFTVRVPQWANQWFHRGGYGINGGWWNYQWQQFFAQNPQASPQQIWQFMEYLRRISGIRDIQLIPYR